MLPEESGRPRRSLPREGGEPQLGDEQVAGALLDHLRTVLWDPSLAYAEMPARLLGGFETRVFSLRLDNPPSELAGPLVLRVFRDFHEPQRPLVETAVHNAVAEMGFPAPRVLMTVTDSAVLGHPFLIMERMPGRTLAAGFEGLGRASSPGQLLRLAMRAPRMLAEVTTTMAELQTRLHQLPTEPLLRAIEAQGLPAEAIVFSPGLEWLRDKIERGGFDGLRPAISWLMAHTPSPPRSPSICHCDFQPFNILMEGGAVTAVIDWGRTTIADPAMDVGFTTANIATIPIEVPRLLRGIFYAIIRAAGRRYYRAYTRLRSVDDAAVRYYQVVNCVGQLVWLADGLIHGHSELGAFQSPSGIKRLIAHVRSLTGLQVSFPIDPDSVARV
jgi:aminoglycoside phosphotransferase (APT) family kinase protein